MRILALTGLVALAGVANAQRPAGDWAWRHVHTQDSVSVRYLFYSEADNVNNGVVLRLDNESSVPVSYRFTALFRSGDAQRERLVEGVVPARSILTGDDEGLFFIPFPDGREVTQIGLRGFRVRRLPPGS